MGLYYFLLLAISLGSLSCDTGESDHRQSQTSEPQPASIDQNPQGKVLYSSHIKPIMEEFCISCHNETAAASAGLPDTDFTSFEGARPYGSLMPSFRLFVNLSSEEQQVINEWIDGGLTEVFYNESAKQVLDQHCTSCHDAAAPARKDLPVTDLSVEQTVKLYGSQLPSFGRLKKVSKQQQEILEKWILDGMQ